MISYISSPINRVVEKKNHYSSKCQGYLAGKHRVRFAEKLPILLLHTVKCFTEQSKSLRSKKQKMR